MKILLAAQAVYVLYFGGMLCLEFHRKEQEQVWGEEMEPQRRCGPAISPWMILLPFIVLIAMEYLTRTTSMLFHASLSYFWNIFLEILVFYTALLLFLPFLRKRIQPGTIAALWLLPNLLYITTYAFMQPEQPLLVIPIPGKLLHVLISLWLVPAAGIFLYGVFQHFMFRNYLLQDAVPAADSEVLNLWHSSQQDMKIKRVIPISVNRKITSPLTIGIWYRTVHLVLPKKTYTQEELKLIFRHELIHILHRDNQAKLFLLLCKALCWFNPLMWMGAKKCSEDLELACDEMVLKNSDAEEKAQYASLILNTVGDERGFTTCLSAGANVLKYRLTEILSTQKKHVGSLVVVLFMLLMILPTGTVALSYNPGTVEDVLFQGNMDSYKLEEDFVLLISQNRWNVQERNVRNVKDKQAVIEFLKNLEVAPMTGVYELMFQEYVSFNFRTDRGLYYMDVYENFLTFYSIKDSLKGRQIYAITEPADLTKLKEYLVVSGS